MNSTFRKIGKILVIFLLIIISTSVANLTIHLWNDVPRPFTFNVKKPILLDEFKPIANHTFLVLIDGVRYDIALKIAKEGVGFLSMAYNEGAWFTNAWTVLPSISPTVRASVFTATIPEIHGIFGYYVENRKEKFTIESNIFSLSKAAGMTTGVITDPLAYGEMWEWIDIALNTSWVPDETTHKITQNYLDGGKLPNLLYICYVETDEMGHEYGVSDEYYRTAKNASVFVEEDYNRTLEISNDTIFIVFSDHGHFKTGGHGGSEPEVMHIFLAFMGKNVKKGVYTESTYVYQIGATMSYILGLELPIYTMLPPLFDVFEASERRKAAYMIYFAQLKINQILGLAEKTGNEEFISKALELNKTLEESYSYYKSGNFSLAYSSASVVSEEAISIFNSLLESIHSSKKLAELILALAIPLIILIAEYIILVKRKLIFAFKFGQLFALINLVLLYGIYFATGFNFSPSVLNFPHNSYIIYLLECSVIISSIVSVIGIDIFRKRRNVELSITDIVIIGMITEFLFQCSLVVYSGILFEPLSLMADILFASYLIPAIIFVSFIVLLVYKIIWKFFCPPSQIR